MTPHEWILSNDTGTSSKTIWAVMMGAKSRDVGWPRDPDDFGRCYRLLAYFPEWRKRLPEVAQQYPAWGPLVEHWDEIERLYLKDLPSGRCEACRRLMSSLHDDCMRAEGWTKTGPGSWTMDKARTVTIGKARLTHKGV